MAWGGGEECIMCVQHVFQALCLNSTLDKNLVLNQDFYLRLEVPLLTLSAEPGSSRQII